MPDLLERIAAHKAWFKERNLPVGEFLLTDDDLIQLAKVMRTMTLYTPEGRPAELPDIAKNLLAEEGRPGSDRPITSIFARIVDTSMEIDGVSLRSMRSFETQPH